MKQSTFLMIFLAINVIANCQVSVLEYIPSSNNSNKKFEKFEVEIKLSQSTFVNPYDESEIDVEVEFVNSGITHKVDAFWYQPFSRCSNCPDPTIIPNNNCSKNPDVADPNYLSPQSTTRPWRARFAPTSSGWWQYRVKVTYNNSTSFTSYKWKFISNSTNKGFIDVADNDQNFSFSNGDIFFPIGMNVVHWGNKDEYNRLAFTFTKGSLEKIFLSNGNIARIWMAPDQFEIEWGTNNLGNYDDRQNRAFDLDEIVEFAEDNNMFLQLVLEAHIQFQDGPYGSDLWSENPYSSLMTGQEDSDEFFTKTSCRDFYKRKLRYIISRWGYSTAIFAFEMFNEVDLYRQNEENVGYWVDGNHANIRNWHDEMIAFARNLDSDKHLFTTSTGWASAGDFGTQSEKLWNSSEIDFTQHHNYNFDLNVENQRNYLAQINIQTYGKPYILGEYGSKLGCWLGTSNFTSSQYTTGNHFHSVNEMHNSLWSTAFSGASGAGMYWWANHVFNDCWGGQYQYFEPLADLMVNIDLLEHDYISISNGCDCSGINDDDQSGGCGGNSPNNCYPLDNVCEQSPNSNFITEGIVTSNECKLEVYALMDEEKIVGWIHNKDNYWYNLPHDAGPNNDTYCQSLDDNQPTNPSDIVILENETMTITGLPCDGIYKIEFFSAYPEYDVDNDGINEDGGIIPSFTLNNIGVHCGDLTFTIPKLQALGTAPYAPDYGFKVSKEQNSWTNILPSTSNSHNINGDISGDNNNSFYKGTDGRLHHYWYGNGQWNHEWLTNWSNSSQNVGGDIAYHDGDVFYKGTDGRLHHYWYGNGQWNHEWLTNWSNSSYNVGGDIAYYDGDVFYKGTDGRLHHFWYGNSQWNHKWLTDWNNSSQNVGGDIAYYDGDVFYKGTDGRLHHYWYGNGQWNHEWLTNWGNSSQNVGNSISTPQVGGKVFYEGSDDRLHEYYFSNGQWNHVWHTDWANTSQNIDGEIACSPDGTHVFYRGNDGYIHQQYYMGNGHWGHDWMICYDYLSSSLKAKSHISSSNNKVFYEGNDSKVHIWEYGNECNPQQFLMISNNEDEIFSTVDLKQNNSISSSSITELEAVSYPNPFSNLLNIKGINSKQSIKVVDVMGRIYFESQNIINSELDISTASWPSGVYIVIVRGGGKTDINTLKVIKND